MSAAKNWLLIGAAGTHERHSTEEATSSDSDGLSSSTSSSPKSTVAMTEKDDDDDEEEAPLSFLGGMPWPGATAAVRSASPLPLARDVGLFKCVPYVRGGYSASRRAFDDCALQLPTLMAKWQS